MLPQLAPMLAVPALPFDATDYVFEVKWDGIRALAAVDGHGWRLWGRGLSDYTARYAELGVLQRWPAETLVDGELVVFQASRPDLRRLLQRHHLLDPLKVQQAPRWCPVHYVLFDLLYYRGRCLLREPLGHRRELLQLLCQERPLPGILFSAGVEGLGRAFYEAVLGQGQEGVVAKALRSAYRPGRRSASWRKIKPGRRPRPSR